MLANLAAASPAGRPARRRCWPAMAGPGASAGRLHGRARPRGGFNSSIARLARDNMRNALIAEGKTVKILCVGRKGYDILKRGSSPTRSSRRSSTCAPCKQLGFVNAETIAREGPDAMLRGGRVRRRDAVLSRVQVGDRADPDGAADHPGRVPRLGATPRMR
jgi:hypothetical protein